MTRPNTSLLPGYLQGTSLIDIPLPGPVPLGGFVDTGIADPAYYLLKPDNQFHRPWIYTPKGNAYIWPGGIDGFQLTSNATTGIHHFIGANGVVVNVVYPDEFHIVLTGTFPGLTSVDNMNALRECILEGSGQQDKLLGLPGLLSQIVKCAVINHQFNHDTGDGSNNITYSIEVIKTGVDGTVNTPPLKLPQSNPTATTTPRGNSSRRVVVKGSGQTLRSIAKKVYGDASQQSLKKLLILNQSVFDAAGLTSFMRTTGILPGGMILNY